MASERQKIVLSQEDKTRFDQVSRINGNLTQPTTAAALLNGWDMLSDEQQIQAIRATAQPIDPSPAEAASAQTASASEQTPATATT